MTSKWYQYLYIFLDANINALVKKINLSPSFHLETDPFGPSKFWHNTIVYGRVDGIMIVEFPTYLTAVEDLFQSWLFN